MGLAYNVYLNAKKIYGCKHCKTHLADPDEIISRVSRTSFLLEVYNGIKLTLTLCRTSAGNTARHSFSIAWSISRKARPANAI